ncbi:NAD(P)-dependent oxidoreductase [Parasphingopyxis sp.]|uniref:NAD(P)-dependent oxidoreductase n=1 Tax=Parasphingopyxis sp. TaxID=1920299 RepID=UPI00261091E7|nr:NAD(P)-dependent oxidoreductase [Parasphingopyxis sp.]
MTTMSVGQIGLGKIGSIYARHLINSGAELTVHDADPSRRERFGDDHWRDTAAETVKDAEFILVSLPDPDASHRAMMGEGGIIDLAKPGALILDVSTIDPSTARALCDHANVRGIDYIEAPVSGGEPMSAGTDGAENANITFMAGGEPDAFERAKPLMKILGEHCLLLGPAGTGSTVKLISNHISGLHNLVAAEAFALGRAAGIDPEDLFAVFAHTDANSYWLFNYFAPRIRNQNFEPGFSVDLQYKDHRLAEDLGRELKVPMPLNAAAMQLYQIIRAKGAGGKDVAEAANLFAEFAGVARYDG